MALQKQAKESRDWGYPSALHPTSLVPGTVVIRAHEVPRSFRVPFPRYFIPSALFFARDRNAILVHNAMSSLMTISTRTFPSFS